MGQLLKPGDIVECLSSENQWIQPGQTYSIDKITDNGFVTLCEFKGKPHNYKPERFKLIQKAETTLASIIAEVVKELRSQ